MTTKTEDSLSLNNKVYLVTGAANGLGRAISYTLASHKATVIMLDKDLRRLESLYDEIIENGWPQPIIHPMDFVKVQIADFVQLSEALEKEFKVLDGVIHNAALFTGFTPIAQYKIETWFEIMQTNLNVPFMITQLSLALLQHSNSAQIVFIEDKAGPEDTAYRGAYSVSKAGANQLMKILCAEYDSQTLAIFGYNPGPMKTALRGKMYPAETSENLHDPDKVARHLIQLLGSSPAKLHGKTINYAPE